VFKCVANCYAADKAVAVSRDLFNITSSRVAVWLSSYKRPVRQWACRCHK